MELKMKIKEVISVILLSILETAGINGLKCEYHFSSHTVPGGTFTSPNFPNDYPDNTYCKYIISGTIDERIRLEFQAFELETMREAGCLFDYVKIIAIDHTGQSYMLARICGSTVPKPIVTKYPTLEVIFKSDYVRGHRGFKAKYEFLSERWQPFPKSSKECGADYMTGPGGVVTSPGFPKPFIPDLECTWMIKVERDKQILLTFHHLDLGPTVKCQGTSVSIYNGFATITDRPEERVCGQLHLYEQGVKEFLSTGFRVVVRYKSSPQNNKGHGGFQLVWTAVKIPKTDMDCQHGFRCAGGVHCIDAFGMLCNSLDRYCIAKELECDEMPNCGFYDKSDELNCNGLTIQIVIIISVVAFLILIVIVISLVLWRRRHNIKNSSSEDLAVKLQNMDSPPAANGTNGQPHHSRHSAPMQYSNNSYTNQNGRRKTSLTMDIPPNDSQLTRTDPNDKNKAYQLIVSCHSDDETTEQL